MASVNEGDTVLVAEDEAINRMYLVSLLENHGYSCVPVKNGREAIDAFRTGCFVAVLMDYRMPGTDGIEAVREIRRIESSRGGHVPIVVLTAYDEEKDREQTFGAGADRLIVKPFTEVSLFEALDSALGGRHMEPPV